MGVQISTTDIIMICSVQTLLRAASPLGNAMVIIYVHQKWLLSAHVTMILRRLLALTFMCWKCHLLSWIDQKFSCVLYMFWSFLSTSPHKTIFYQYPYECHMTWMFHRWCSLSTENQLTMPWRGLKSDWCWYSTLKKGKSCIASVGFCSWPIECSPLPKTDESLQ